MPLRVVTLNVWGLPWGIARDTTARISAIARRLEAPDSEFDTEVVALQEVWTREARDTLLAAGDHAGYSHVWHNPALWGGSGLLVLSRLPILDAAFTPFHLRGFPERIDHADYNGGKGFALLRLGTPDGPIRLLNTHLHARYAPSLESDQYLELRVGQAVQLAVAVRQVKEPLVALGDFNVRPDEPEYRVLMGLAGWVDAAAALRAAEPTVSRTNAYQGDRTAPEERIDYVFTRDGREQSLRARSVRRVFDEPLELGGRPAAYSDHFGVWAELERADPGSRQRLPDPEAVALAEELLARGLLHSKRRERRQQRGALGAAGGAAGLWAAGGFTRREGLRRLLRAFALLGLTGGAGVAWLGTGATPEESRAFQATQRELATLSDAAKPGSRAAELR